MRLAAVAALFLVACSGGASDNGSPASSSRTNPPSAPTVSKAADLRTHLDLLLGEHVMIVAKESAAAANHSDSYTSYTALLTTNLNDLTDVMRSAFGSTAADQFAQVWSTQNGYLVDYAIGVVTHNDAKANDSMHNLNDTFVPGFAKLFTDIAGLPTDPVGQLASEQVLEDKAFIDDVGAQKFSSFYPDLMRAYTQSSRLGDPIAERVAQKFPDKFPGNPGLPPVDTRVSLNLLLQQHALLATMATDAVVAKRDADKTGASAALGVNADAISRSLSDLFGRDAGTQFDRVWAARDSGLLAYAAKGDADTKKSVTDTVSQFSSLAHAPNAAVSAEVNALLKVVDEQRAKSLKSIGDDDRAAATSMEPIANAISAAQG